MIRNNIVALLFLTVAACNKKPSEPVAAPPLVSKGGDVQIVVDDKGFTPASIQVPKGTATRLVFKRTTDKTCATEVAFPELSLKKPLPLNENVAVDLPVGDTRTIGFQCGMGMFKSAVVIQ